MLGACLAVASALIQLLQPRLEQPKPVFSVCWRIRALDASKPMLNGRNSKAWKWDVSALRFKGFAEPLGVGLAAEPPPKTKKLAIKAAISSGSASDKRWGGHPKYEAHGMLTGSGVWGGRPDNEGELWVGANFSRPVWVGVVTYMDQDAAPSVALEYCSYERLAEGETGAPRYGQYELKWHRQPGRATVDHAGWSTMTAARGLEHSEV